MRYKLIIAINHEKYGNVLPVSYQYELASCFHRIFTNSKYDYHHWLTVNGFNPNDIGTLKLYSISNLYIPKIKVDADRLHIYAEYVQLWISTILERDTLEVLSNIFLGRVLVIGDMMSKVEMRIDDIVPCEEQEISETMNYISLSPIVIINKDNIRSTEYLAYNAPNYNEYLLDSILARFKRVYGYDFNEDPNFSVNIISIPKRKGIFIKRFTPYESKVIGYMYKFQLKMHPMLQYLIYNIGIGDKTHFGFGSIEVLRRK